jgi:glucose-6-phosphate dehydrogenase assembly protein OpcA
MSTTLWDTNGSEVLKALAAERRSSGAVASGLALTLIVVVDEKGVPAAEEAATTAAAAHPCRLIVVVRRKLDAEDRLDAEVAVGGRLGATQSVVLRMWGRLTLHAESVVLPLLAPDAPVFTWWVGEPPDRIAFDPLGVFSDRRVTDCAATADAVGCLRTRADDFAPGDTDLTWTRTTPWRSLLASAYDPAPGCARPAATGGRVVAESGNPSAALLAGWLSHRFGIDVPVEESKGPGVTHVELDLEDGSSICLTRPDGRVATMTRTGQPDRTLPLPRRELGELMTEELRRLDHDAVYAEALAAATGVTDDLSTRSPVRTHIWRDPAEQAAAEAAPV